MKQQGLLDLDQAESRGDVLPLQYGHPSASNGPKKGWAKDQAFDTIRWGHSSLLQIQG
jgi:hypothetical protein